MSIRSVSRRASCGEKPRLRATQFTSIFGITILKQPDYNLPNLPRDDEGPVFAEPWQAQAFALAVKLSEEGHFTWKEWAHALAQELKAATERGECDDGTQYYHHWLRALEGLVTEKGLTDAESLEHRKLAWADAYRHTPHGKPVELRRN